MPVLDGVEEGLGQDGAGGNLPTGAVEGVAHEGEGHKSSQALSKRASTARWDWRGLGGTCRLFMRLMRHSGAALVN